MISERQVLNNYNVSKEVTLLDVVSAIGSGQAEVIDYFNHTFHLISSSVTTGSTILIQSSLDGTNWNTLSTNVISTNGVLEVSYSGKYKYLRANLFTYTDGTYSVFLISGN